MERGAGDGRVEKGEKDKDEFIGGEWRCKGWMEKEWIGWIDEGKVDNISILRQGWLYYVFSSASTEAESRWREEELKKRSFFHPPTALFYILLYCWEGFSYDITHPLVAILRALGSKAKILWDDCFVCKLISYAIKPSINISYFQVKCVY